MVSVNNAYRTIAQLYGCLLHIAGHFCKFECFAVALCLGMLHTPLVLCTLPVQNLDALGGPFSTDTIVICYLKQALICKKSGIEKAQML